jgi:alkylation response protein AidB-like acyl-CoA dehydrogenase
MAEPFFQEPPQLTNTYEADAALRETLERLVPRQVHDRLVPEWRDLGEAAAGPLLALAHAAESEPPRLVPYDAWGRRVDRLVVSPAWRELQSAAARRGLTAIPYEKRLGTFARLHQFALLNLYGPSSAIFTCYLAMTDGAARTLLEHAPSELAQRVVPRLTSRDPESFWTSGQWMTERTGGSDVSGTSTRAVCGPDGRWRLFGTKWFTSATTSEIALTLARAEGGPAGSAGLSLFYLEQRLADGGLNGIHIHRLKDKLGTRALPTAELSLEGTLAEPLGSLGGGVKKITPLLNITRLHNAISACGMMARQLHLLRDYARRRVVFGEALARKPLHRATLAALQIEYEAALALTFECARLLGRQEAGEASDEERACLRLLTPLCKLSTAKQAVAAASETLEGFGGAGYIEDTGLPVHLRDAQVLPIWEGTTNVLSLDVLRAAARDGVLAAWLEASRRRVSALAQGQLVELAAILQQHLEALDATFAGMQTVTASSAEAEARRFALALAAVAAAVPLAEQGAWALAEGRGARSAVAARRYVLERLPPVPDHTRAEQRLAESAELSGLG